MEGVPPPTPPPKNEPPTRLQSFLHELSDTFWIGLFQSLLTPPPKKPAATAQLTPTAGEPPSDNPTADAEQRVNDEQAKARNRRAFQHSEKMAETVRQQQYEKRHGKGYSQADGSWVSVRRPKPPKTPDPASPLPTRNPLPTSPDPERDAQIRYVVWLVVGIALFVTGVGALYSMYSSPAAGFVPLAVALCLAVSGAYIGLAAVFNFWLPRPPIQRIRHHIKVSAAVLVGLVFIGCLVAWKFPRKAASPDSSMSSITPTSAAPYATAQATPKTTVAIATPKRPKQMPLTIHGHAILDVSPDRLESLCEGYTSLQCDKLRKPYEDKWVRWTGVVNDVDDGPGVLLHVPSAGSYRGYAFVGVSFKESERNEVVHLRVGDKITIVGRLVYGMGGILEDAELLRNVTTDEPKR
jgi:hypothetical protein